MKETGDATTCRSGSSLWCLYCRRSQIDIPSEICFSTFHPQISACVDGLLMIIWGALLGQPVYHFRPRQDRKAYMLPTKAPSSVPTSVQTSIFKAFYHTEQMDAEGLACKLLLSPSGDPCRAPEKQTVGTVTASHKMLTLQALSSSQCRHCKEGLPGPRRSFWVPSGSLSPKTAASICTFIDFTVGEKVVISAEGSHSGGQLLRAIISSRVSCRGNMGLRHVHIALRCSPPTSGTLVAEVGFLSFSCSGAVRTSVTTGFRSFFLYGRVLWDPRYFLGGERVFFGGGTKNQTKVFLHNAPGEHPNRATSGHSCLERQKKAPYIKCLSATSTAGVRDIPMSGSLISCPKIT